MEEKTELQDIPIDYLKLILEKNHIAAAIFRMDGTKVYSNPAYLKISDYRNPDDFWIFRLCKTLRESDYFQGEISLITQSGIRKEYVLHAYTIDKKAPEYLVFFYINITLFNQMQNNFLENERRLNLALVSSGSGLWEFSLEDDTLTLDRQSYAVGGYGFKEFAPSLGHIHKRIHPQDKQQTVSYIIQNIKQRKALNIEFRFLHKNGKYIWIHLLGRITLRRYLGLLRNISVRKQKEIYNHAVSQAQRFLLEPEIWTSKAQYLTNIVRTTLTTSSLVTLWQLEPGFKCFGDCPLLEYCDRRGDCYQQIALSGDQRNIVFKNKKRFPHRFSDIVFFQGKANSYMSDKVDENSELKVFFDFGDLYYSSIAVYRLHDSNSKTLGLLMVNAKEPLDKEADIFLQNVTDLSSQSLINDLYLKELEQSRESILEKNKRLTLITQGINSSIDGVGISTKEGELYYVNQRFLDLFFFPFKGNRKESFKKLFNNEKDFNFCLDSASDGLRRRKEVEMIIKNGEIIIVALRFSSFKENTTGDLSIIWTFTDITQQVMARKKIQKYTKTIEKDLREKTELLRKAHLLQKQLIQREFPQIDGFDISALYMPCEDLGGDFFHIIRGLNRHKLALIMGDCTGHGINASMESSLISSICTHNLQILFNDNDTGNFLRVVNKEFGEQADDDQFPTMFAAVLDLDSNTLFYSNANSPLPYIYREGKILQLRQPGGLHFNINYFDNPTYETEFFQFREGDRMFIYSDAFLELDTREDPKKAALELKETFLGMSEKNQYGFADILEYLNTKNGTLPLDDDSTLLELDYLGITEEQFSFRTEEEWADKYKSIRDIMTARRIPRDTLEEILICIDELSLNAISHGNNNSDNTIMAYIKISCRYVEFSVEDQGEGFNRKNLKDPSENWEELMSLEDDEMMHGRGLWMVRNFSDVLEFNAAGNKAYMIKGLPARKLVQI